MEYVIYDGFGSEVGRVTIPDGRDPLVAYAHEHGTTFTTLSAAGYSARPLVAG